MTLLEAEENLLPLAKDYILPIKFVILSFLFTQIMAAYLRNDGNPGLATKAVLIAGIFNIFEDYFFVFITDQGIYVTQKGNRIHQTLRYALITAAVFGMLWTVLVELSPNLFIHIFMKPTEHILAISPNIIRSYGISFLLLPFNIFSTYYFQALMQSKTSFIISVLRGFVISGILSIVLPQFVLANAIWFAMPITELLISIFVVVQMCKFTKELPHEDLATA